MCDKLTDSDKCHAFLSVHHWTFPCTASSISWPSGSHILCAISNEFANLVLDLISLPEKFDSFQGLLLDHLICAKYLFNSLHIIVPAVLPVLIAFLFRNFLVMLLLCFPWHVTTPDASSSLLLELFDSLLLVCHWLSLTDPLYAWNTLVSSPLGQSRLTSWRPPYTTSQIKGLSLIPIF